MTFATLRNRGIRFAIAAVTASHMGSAYTYFCSLHPHMTGTIKVE
jgi:plastocyanin